MRALTGRLSLSLQTTDRVILHMMKLKPKQTQGPLDKYAEVTNEGDAAELR